MRLRAKTIQVAIPTFNRKELVYKQVTCLLDELKGLNQVKILVSDNGSTDGTLTLLKSLDDKRLQLIWKEENEGYQENFLYLCEFVNSDYVIFLSDEDSICVSSLKKLIKDLSRHNYNFLSSNVRADGKNYRMISKKRSIKACEYWKSSHYLSGLVFSKSIVSSFIASYRSKEQAKNSIYPQVLLASHAIAKGASYWLGYSVVYSTVQLKTNIPSYTSFNNRLRQHYEISELMIKLGHDFPDLGLYEEIIKSHQDRTLQWILPTIYKDNPARAIFWILKSIILLLKLSGSSLYASSSKLFRRG